MAIHCPIGFDAQALEQEVRSIYASLARDPTQSFHFHRGVDYAVSHLGYDRAQLEAVPAQSSAVFAGVGNPHAIRPLEVASRVLDVGCGGGMDLMLAAAQVGPQGQATGIDMTSAMLERCRSSISALDLDHVSVQEADVHALPLSEHSVDQVISNGVLNLSTDKAKAFGEIYRVLRPGGHLQFADIVVADELPQGVRADAELWAA